MASVQSTAVACPECGGLMNRGAKESCAECRQKRFDAQRAQHRVEAIEKREARERSRVRGDATDLAWAAGFIDGDGSIHLNGRRQHGYRTRVLTIHATQVGRDGPPSLMKLIEIFGGEARIDRSTGRRPAWRWRLVGPRAADCIRSLLPYLVQRAEQAVLALEAYAYRGRGQIDVLDHYEARLRGMKRETKWEDEYETMQVGLRESEALHGERWAEQRERAKAKAKEAYA